MTGAARRPWFDRLGVVFLALLAYVPSFASAPHRVPADTKLYLYLNPGRLLADAVWSWDNRQFAGWVPHQTIGYLWPSGPWFWIGQHLGLPDWVTHRLWIGTILFVAGLGVRWCARRLGLTGAGVLLAAVVYQLSPYVLPYISRTSVLLLPWAGLGWLVGITLNTVRRGGWRDPALFALVVATVGGINATAMAMIAPAPVLIVLDAVARRELTGRRAAVLLARIGGLSVVVSLWWLVALSVQAAFGAPVLNYTETLQSVSFTSNSTEALRGLGYWLFYVRDPTGPLTTMSIHYQLSTTVMAAGFALILAGLAGLVVVEWRGRRLAAWLALVGVVLAVGAHPLDDPSPLGAPLAHSARSTLTLALRSSTRAVPLAVLALALGAGALITAVRLRRPRVAPVAAAGLVWLAVVNLPAVRHPQLVDPVLAHPEVMPSWWTEVAAALDRAPATYRTLQLPGTESAVARWGQTVDPVLPGLTTRDVVQRDWLPLGSAPAMDLFYALDGRFQSGTLDPASIAPVARLFGADSIVYAGDVAFDKFRTARPELTWSTYSGRPTGLGVPVEYGVRSVNTPAVPMVDDRSLSDPRIGTPVPQTAIVPVLSPITTARAKTGTTLVVGSGEGVVAAASAGLVTGDELLRYSAAETDASLATVDTAASLVILTDSDRKQAEQWRGSQDQLGYVEGADDGVLRTDPADHRLPVFPDQTVADQTVAEQVGPVTAAATSYGEPNAFRPEDRADQAVDGDPSTAWRTADRTDAVGETLRLTLRQATAVHAVTVVQPQDPTADRWITAVDVITDHATTRVALDDSSRTPSGQRIPVEATTGTVSLRIAATSTGVRPNYAGQGPVGFAEVRIDDLAPTHELLRLPTRTGEVPASTSLAVVLERWRVDPANRWRADPERTLSRQFELTAARAFDPSITVRLAPRAADAVVAAALGSTRPPTASTRLSGTPTSGGIAAVDGDPATAWTTAFGAATGSTLTVPLAPATTLDSFRLTVADDPEHSRPTELTVTMGGQKAVVPIDPRGTQPVTVGFPTMTGDTLSVTVSAIEPRYTVDRRTGEPAELPVSVSDLSGPGIPVASLPAHVDTGCRNDLVTLDGAPVGVRISAESAALLAGDPVEATVCSASSVALVAGSHVLETASGLETGWDVDRVVLRSPGATSSVAAGGPQAAAPTVTTIERTHGSRTFKVAPCPAGCWLVSGDGWNPGWSAAVGGHSLGRPTVVDGGFNGWWIAPTTSATVVHLTWTPQRSIWLALGLSIVGVLVCFVIVGRTWGARRTDPMGGPLHLDAPWRRDESSGRRRLVAPIVAAVLGGLAIAPLYGAVALVIVGAAAYVRRPRLAGLVSMALVLRVALTYIDTQRVHRWLPGFGWVVNIASTHRLTLLALVLLVAAVVAAPSTRSPVPASAGVELAPEGNLGVEAGHE